MAQIGQLVKSNFKHCPTFFCIKYFKNRCNCMKPEKKANNDKLMGINWYIYASKEFTESYYVLAGASFPAAGLRFR